MSFKIPERARTAERTIVRSIQLLDDILNEAEIVTDDIDGIATLCEGITKAYDKAKSALNELQQS